MYLLNIRIILALLVERRLPTVLRARLVQVSSPGGTWEILNILMHLHMWAKLAQTSCLDGQLMMDE